MREREIERDRENVRNSKKSLLNFSTHIYSLHECVSVRMCICMRVNKIKRNNAHKIN